MTLTEFMFERYKIREDKDILDKLKSDIQNLIVDKPLGEYDEISNRTLEKVLKIIDGYTEDEQ